MATGFVESTATTARKLSRFARRAYIPINKSIFLVRVGDLTKNSFLSTFIFIK